MCGQIKGRKFDLSKRALQTPGGSLDPTRAGQSLEIATAPALIRFAISIAFVHPSPVTGAGRPTTSIVARPLTCPVHLAARAPS